MQNGELKMSLNITSAGGSYDPYVKYNGKAGRWFMKVNDQDTEIGNPVFVADFANIKTGWFKFTPGMAPDKVFDAGLGQAAAQPSSDHKRGFQLRLFSQKSFGGVVELSGASVHLNSAISELYGQYESGVKQNPNMLPVVKCTGTQTMKDKKGTNYKPTFVIEKWVPRPAEFAAQAPQAPQAAPAPAVADTGDSEF